MNRKSCCRCHCVLLLLLLTVTTGSLVKVNLHGAATLPCSQTCSGLVTWTVSHKQRDILAQCDQISCQSQEGFHMYHDQYLKGDLSLTITDVDYTKRAWYTCTCNNKDICDVSLQIEALNSSVKMKPGDSLVLDLPPSEPVEVIYNSTEVQPHPDRGQGVPVPVLVWTLMGVLVLLLVGSVVMNVWQWRTNQLQKRVDRISSPGEEHCRWSLQYQCHCSDME
ncbi:uncharacterized protein LOC143509889 isoform X2 [Brachyhypopomus gauderio]|uniref:uncharacterized protein LOC143509889 isoform X2 n=1 Tax=Brachyhypopomus gauderio TaxID=698409 RepID=UPI004042145A